MNSYLIDRPDEDLLKVGFSREKIYSADCIVRDAENRLDELVQAGELAGGSLLKINGRMSLPVSYTIAHKLGHLYGAIAVYDPRLKAYIVAISTNPDYKVGDTIDEKSNAITSKEYESTNSSFLVNLTADGVLKVGFNSQIEATGDRIVKDAVRQLDRLIESEKLHGKLLKISGRASVAASFAIACKLAHSYGAIALFEPKEGDSGIDRYVVSISHSPDYQVGQALDFATSYNYQHSQKIALCGFPGIGKTVFRDGLQAAIRQQINLADDFLYVVSGCPDGDYPAWVAATAKNDTDLAYRLRKACQAKKFTPELATAIAQGITAIKNPLTVFDVGGKISLENREILPSATHAVILAKEATEVKQWQEFCDNLNLPIIATIYSDLEARKDLVRYKDNLLTGRVHYLQRGEDVSDRPMICELASLLISLAKQKANTFVINK